jgi:DNA-binding NtrC family response regulator
MDGNSSREAITVLVVDDEALIRWSLNEALSACGHLVIEASSGRSALDAIEAAREQIDVVLLDYRLPDSDNLDLLAIIRQRLPSSAVVLMTAYGALELAQHALSLGAYRVLHKPLDMHDVDPLVRDAHAASQH